MLDKVPKLPGYVRASASGRPLCKVKYIGNNLFCRAANCGRGRVLNATIPPMKLLK
jgi:hypothetical protein